MNSLLVDGDVSWMIRLFQFETICGILCSTVLKSLILVPGRFMLCAFTFFTGMSNAGVWMHVFCIFLCKWN